ncbi:MAG: biopolymer transporter ExbD [Phycisphaerae bacterium]
MTQQSPTSSPAAPAGPAVSKKPGRPVAYTPNVVPLIDVLFMLLLFFLLSTRFRQEEGDIAGMLPPSQPPPITEPIRPPPLELVLNIRPTGGALRNGAVYTFQRSTEGLSGAKELYEGLQRAKGRLGRSEVLLRIRPSEDVRWAFVVEAFNQAKRARFEGIAFDRP